MFTVTLLELVLPIRSERFTAPLPTKVRGSGPMFTWSRPGYCDCAAAPTTGTGLPPMVALTVDRLPKPRMPVP